MEVLTALGNNNLFKKLKTINGIKLYKNDIQYREGIIEVLKENKNINLIIIYEKIPGNIEFEGENINNLKTDEIARKGIFMSFQSPEEIPGISVMNFLKYAKNKTTGQPVKVFQFKEEIAKNMEELKMNASYINRNLNVGFSGGEKKKTEILQMLTLQPKLAILDETDSGLDVDAIRIVSKGIKMFSNENNATLIITHGTKILKELDVDYVHILVNGQIVTTKGGELAKEIEENGYAQYIS